MLNVYFSMKNANDIEKIPAAGDGKVDVAALRYTYSTENGDTLITSDYAALKQYKITDFAINKVTARGNMEEKIENHLAATKPLPLTIVCKLHTRTKTRMQIPKLQALTSTSGLTCIM